MKLLVSSFGSFGHLLPLLPLARAAERAGDTVTVTASADMAGVAPDLPFVASGPTVAEIFAENIRRTGFDPTAEDSPAVRRASYQLFTGTRIDMSLDALRETVRSEAPDVLVAEEWDYLAPVIAGETGLPWFPVNHSPRTIADIALEESALRAYEQLGLSTAPPSGRIQWWPQWLQGYGYVPVGDEIDVQPSAHRGESTSTLNLDFPDRRPLVLVTMGTAIADAELFVAAIRAAVDAGANVVATRSALLGTDDLDVDEHRVRVLSFTPLDDVFRTGLDAVLTVGGSGTTLAALSYGVPLIMLPRNYNQPVVADLVANYGAGLTCRKPERIGSTIATVLGDNDYRAHAEQARLRLLEAPTPDQAWQMVKERRG